MAGDQTNEKYKLTIAGIVTDDKFHKCIACINELSANYPEQFEIQIL